MGWRIHFLSFYRWGGEEKRGLKVQTSENVCSTGFCLCPGNVVQEGPWYSKPSNGNTGTQKWIVWGLEGRESRKWEGEFSESCLFMSDSLWLYSNSPGQNTGMGSLSLFQGIFPTQGLNPGLLHCKWILYQLSHKGSPRILEWVAYPFSRRSSQPKNWTGVSYIAGRFFTNWAIREGEYWNENWTLWTWKWLCASKVASVVFASLRPYGP